MRDMKNNRHYVPDKSRLLAFLTAGAITTALLIIGFNKTSNNNIKTRSFLCTLTGSNLRTESDDWGMTPIQFLAILHYATSFVVPQQSLAEITISYEVLMSLAPCNFLVFGLGHDSLMWASLNPRGNTLFLEEDPRWVQTILRRTPFLHAATVRYHTRLYQSDDLLSNYKSVQDCSPSNLRLRDSRCDLALTELPAEVFEKEWDVIMIDAPRGYFPEAPGRMAAIYSAAVMARARKQPGVTHVFLHDVDRKVEKTYAQEFLCMKFKVNGEGRLWHFEIPPAANMSYSNTSFC